MQKQKWQKVSILLIVTVMFLSGFAPNVNPINSKVNEYVVFANENKEEYISVEEALKRDQNNDKVSVTGYIVGHITSGNVSNDPSNFKDNFNFAMADNPSETNKEKMIFVQVTGSFRAEFGLDSNPELLGKKINVTGSLNKFHSHNGLKEPLKMSLVSDDGTTPDEPEELELITIKKAREQYTGEVKTKGTVTAKLKNTIHIEDGEAGLAIRPTSLDVNLGDEIIVVGTLNDYKGLLQLNNATLEEKVSNTEISPKLISVNDLSSHQSELVKLEQVTITEINEGNGWANYVAKDKDQNNFIIRDENGILGLELGNYDSIIGISSRFDDDIQIIPRSLQDIIFDKNAVQPVFATPNSGTVPDTTKVALTTYTEDAEIYYTLDGSNPSTDSEKYTQPILIDKDLTLKAVAIKDGKISEIRTFEYTVYSSVEGIAIHDIQGEGHVSPMVGQLVKDVKGVVTYKYDIRGANYFHIQTPNGLEDNNPKTSEGIVVYTGKAENIKVGNLVAITGVVDEYHIDGYSEKQDTDLSVTQINARDDRGGKVEVLEEVVDLPEPIKIRSTDIPDTLLNPNGFDTFEPENYSIDFWESIEGMRVEIEPSQAIAPQQHGDLVVITDEYEPEMQTVNGGIRLSQDAPDSRTIQFKLQPNDMARNFAVKTGDKFTEPITGVVNYGFGNYKVYADLSDLSAAFEEGPAQPRKTTIVKDSNKLTVAAYNVENFSANKADTPDSKAENIAKVFVDNMNSPDIIGLVEIMANMGTSSNNPKADESYKRLINEIKNAGGPEYKFVNIDPEFNADGGAPGGNIRVGYLYNPERVDFVKANHGGSKDAVGYNDGKLTLNPGRVSPTEFKNTRKPLAAQFEFNGESIVIINNHLNSKLGDQPYYGQNQPPVMGSREQRNHLATVINEFVKEIKMDNPDENIVVLGDMNDFEFSEPLNKLKGNELTNMIERVPEEERYSYVYQGSSQVLDHLLVSNNLADVTEIDVISVNSDFTDMHGRASDHDPILSQIDLAASKDLDDYFDLSIMHLNDTHSRVEMYPKIIAGIKEYRSENEDALLFHAGDVFSGTLYFNEHKGQADLALLNLMGIDAMTFGNHEFDLGVKEGGNESLSKFVKKANFPMLGTNIDFSKDIFMKDLDTQDSLVENPQAGQIYDSIVIDVNGEKVGVFGLLTEDTKVIASGKDVEFNDYIASAEKAVKEFEEAGINKIIAVTHLGYDVAPEIGNDYQLAQRVEGIDIIVGGHSHTELAKPVVINEDADGKQKDPTVIVQSGEYANNLGTLQVKFDADGRIVESDGALIPVKDLKDDEEALNILEPYKDAVEELSNTETGAIAMKDLLNPRHGGGSEISVRANETELGNLITDAMLAKTKEKFPDTVIAVQNGGGIRAAIMEGPITVGEIISVLPFGNDPVVVDLTGAEIKEILEHSVRMSPDENGGFLHVSGMKYYYDSKKDVGDRVVKMFVLQEGEEVEIKLDQTYKVTTNGFTGQGGDGFDTFAKAHQEGRVHLTGEIDWEQLQDYITSEKYLNKIVDPKIEGRIIDLKGDDLPDDEDPEIQKLLDRISQLKEILTKLKEQNKDLAGEVDELYKFLSNLERDIIAKNGTIEEFKESLSELEARISELEKQEPTDPTKPTVPEDPEKPTKPEVTDAKQPATGIRQSTYLVNSIILLSGIATLLIIRRKRIQDK